METIVIERSFRFKDKDTQEHIYMHDIGRDFQPDDVRNHYAATYPILTTARVGPAEFIEVDGKLTEVYTFETAVGLKG